MKTINRTVNCALIALMCLAMPATTATLRAQTTTQIEATPAKGVSTTLARTLFLNMPDTVLPLLTKVNREDCVDFLDSHMRAQVTNRLQGTSELLALTSDYARMQLSPASTWSMKVLPVNDSTAMICTVVSVTTAASGYADVAADSSASVADSRIAFFDAQWCPLPASDYLPRPLSASDFLLPRPSDMTEREYAELVCQADFLACEATFVECDADSPACDATLTFRYTTPQYMEKTAAEKLRPLLRASIVYVWNPAERKFSARP